MTSEVPRPDEPFDAQPSPESPTPGDHTPHDHLGREGGSPPEPSPEPTPSEPGRTGTPKGGCALLLFLVVLGLVGLTTVPLALLLG